MGPMASCVECVSVAYVALYDAGDSAFRWAQNRFPVVFRATKSPLSVDDYIRIEADIQSQIAVLGDYVSKLDRQVVQCKQRARMPGVSRERQLALYSQCRRLDSLRGQALRQIGVLENSVLVLQSNSMGMDLAQTVQTVSRVCRASLRGVESESLISGIESSMATIHESIQVSNELHETFATACNSMGDGTSTDSVDECELDEFLRDGDEVGVGAGVFGQCVVPAGLRKASVGVAECRVEEEEPMLAT